MNAKAMAVLPLVGSISTLFSNLELKTQNENSISRRASFLSKFICNCA